MLWQIDGKLVGSPQVSARMSFILQLSYHSHFEARSWEWLFKRRLGTKIGVCSCTVCSLAQAECTVCSSYVLNAALLCTTSAHHASNFVLLILHSLCWALIMHKQPLIMYVPCIAHPTTVLLKAGHAAKLLFSTQLLLIILQSLLWSSYRCSAEHWSCDLAPKFLASDDFSTQYCSALQNIFSTYHCSSEC